MKYENPWIYKEKEIGEEDIPKNAVSFVYIITNKSSSKFYIGKKTLFFKRSRKIKGKKRKINIKSDWETYYGSNNALNEDRIKLGNNCFSREILRFCSSKGEASYWESKLIFEKDALISNEYYNDWISCRIRRAHLKNLIIS
jgi:hypothetical protein